MSDRYAHWKLGADGRWVRHHRGPDGTPLDDLQSDLIAFYAKRRRKASR